MDVCIHTSIHIYVCVCIKYIIYSFKIIWLSALPCMSAHTHSHHSFHFYNKISVVTHWEIGKLVFTHCFGGFSLWLVNHLLLTSCQKCTMKEDLTLAPGKTKKHKDSIFLLEHTLQGQISLWNTMSDAHHHIPVVPWFGDP